MGRMVRKQVYIEPEQDTRLKEVSHHLGVSESEIVRRGVTQILQQYPSYDPTSRDAWLDELKKMRERIDSNRSRGAQPAQDFSNPPDVSTFEPESLSEEEIERRWQQVLKDMREGRFAHLIGNEEEVWNREKLYEERLNRLPG